MHGEKKLIVGAALAVALYFAVTCPCSVYLECHRKYYLAALAVAAVPALVPMRQ